MGTGYAPSIAARAFLRLWWTRHEDREASVKQLLDLAFEAELWDLFGPRAAWYDGSFTPLERMGKLLERLTGSIRRDFIIQHAREAEGQWYYKLKRQRMFAIQMRLETVHWKRLQASGNFQRTGLRDVDYNTLAKVVRAAVDYFLSLDEADRECPRQMRVRKEFVKVDMGKPPPEKPYLDNRPAKRFLVQIPEEQHRALSSIKQTGCWPSIAEIVLTALDLWLPLNFPFSAEEEWMREHDPTRGSWVEKPRPYPPEGTFRTVEEHNTWRDREHPKPLPRRRIYKQRKLKEEEETK